MLHVEYGGSSHVGRHDQEPIDGEGILNPNQWKERPNQLKITALPRWVIGAKITSLICIIRYGT